MNDLPRPRFTGIFIPVEILERKELSHLELILLSWIDALYSKEHGGCFASNAYLAERLDVKENTIAKSLTNLRSLGFIEDISFNGRQRVIRSLIGRQADRTQSNAGLEKNPTPIGEKSNPELEKNPSEGTLSPYNTYRKEEKKEDIKEKERTADAYILTEFFNKKLKERMPHVIPKENWVIEMDRMLTIDKRKPDDIKKAIEIIADDKWFNTNILCTKSLRKNFDKIYAKISIQPKLSRIDFNRSFALKEKNQNLNHPEFKFFKFDSKGVTNIRTQKDVPFDLPEQQFKEIFARVFGGSI